MTRIPLVMLLLSVSLSGCFRGSSVKGDFACKTPGGTCAPMTIIDGEALAGMSSGGIGAIRTPGTLPPPTAPVRTGSIAGLDDTAPARSAERVLRVVFPAHIDSDGVYREEAAAHAVVEPSAWARALGVPATEPRRLPALRQGGAVPAVPAAGQQAAVPAPGLLAGMDEVVAALAARRTGAAAAAAPAAAPVARSAPVQVANPAAGAGSTPFTGPSRAGVQLSLAEAAAGLAAPPLPHLDPSGPGNYDTPDVTAGMRPAQPDVVSTRPASALAGTSASTDAVTRTVRSKGKTFTIPLARAVSTRDTVEYPGVTTAALNRRALLTAGDLAPQLRAEAMKEERLGSAPAGAVPETPAQPASATSAQGNVAARVRAMAGPQPDPRASKDGVIDRASTPASPVSQEPRP